MKKLFKKHYIGTSKTIASKRNSNWPTFNLWKIKIQGTREEKSQPPELTYTWITESWSGLELTLRSLDIQCPNSVFLFLGKQEGGLFILRIARIAEHSTCFDWSIETCSRYFVLQWVKHGHRSGHGPEGDGCRGRVSGQNGTSTLELQTIHRISQSRRRPLLGPSSV